MNDFSIYIYKGLFDKLLKLIFFHIHSGLIIIK
nr:MAG TPA: hypothetical protein [Caudoviricetes sp.]DAR45184.1 MAG TPA: hypothetical protein [Caudoviricetes sp.]DAY98922.1 MAG TPA: hypothetical protein [Caudoviricetes sp.]